MRKNSISFLKIKVYRRKFLGTTIAILLLCTICFIGVTTFFYQYMGGPAAAGGPGCLFRD